MEDLGKDTTSIQDEPKKILATKIVKKHLKTLVSLIPLRSTTAPATDLYNVVYHFFFHC